MARDYKLVTAVLGVAMRVLLAWQRRQARRAGYAGAQNAAVTFIQRFGGAMNSNLHMHVLLPDGVFVLGEHQPGQVREGWTHAEDGSLMRLSAKPGQAQSG